MFYDRPMGTGKTQTLLHGFDPNTKYLVVHEYLEQCQEVIDNPAGVHFEQPVAHSGRTKGDHLHILIRQGKNVVTTHALYTSLVELAKYGWLSDYVIVIDETLEPLGTPQGPEKGVWEALVRDEWVSVNRQTGKVTASAKWGERRKDVSKTLTPQLLEAAKAGLLYVTQNRHMFVIPIPVELLTAGNSVTIMTFMAESSPLTAYLERLGVPYVINRDFQEEAKLRSEIRRWVTLRSISALDGLKFSYTGQTNPRGRAKVCNRVQNALKNLRGRLLGGIPLEMIMISCAKENWYNRRGSIFDENTPSSFSKGSRMFGACWVNPSVRGLNKFRHCSIAISLYDYHLHPAILEWLGKENDREFKDRFAVSELLQFLYRSRIRCRSSIPDPSVTLFLPSGRMRDRFLTWVNQDVEPEAKLKVTR